MVTVASLLSEETQAFPTHSPEIFDSAERPAVVHFPSSLNWP